MNCVIERRRAEELVDGTPKTVSLPFGINLQTEPKKQRVTGERIAIVCESNSEPQQQEEEEREEPEIHVRQFIVPFQQRPIPYGNMPNPGMGPLTHMPMRMEPPREQPSHPMISQMPPIPPFLRQLIAQQIAPQLQQQQQQLPVPQQIMQAPPMQQPQIRIFQSLREDPQPEVRIQLHRIAIPGPIRIPEQSIDRDESQQPEQVQQIQQIQQQQQQSEQPRIQVQQVPLNLALQRAGITPEDLINIQKIAEAKFRQEMTRFAQEIDDDTESSEASDEEMPQQRPQMIQIIKDINIDEPTSDDKPMENNNEQPQENPNILPMGRSGFARSLLKPVNIPVQMMPKSELDSTAMPVVEDAPKEADSSSTN